MRARFAACVVVAALVVFGCEDPIEVGFNSAAGASGNAGASGSGGASAGQAGAPIAGAGVCQPVDCRGKRYECGNCDDDDDDGLVDSADPDCLGPCDDSENSFARDNAASMACRQDCYFDRNSGTGNDCVWSHVCDPVSIAPDFPPSGDASCAHQPDASVMGSSCSALREEQPPECRDNCLPLTPNGCDCFGCCELPAGSDSFVWLGSNVGGAATCTLSSVNDESACRPCTPVPSCMNECDACELCVGKPAIEASCGSGGEAPCAGGLPRCSSTSGCGAGAYCITGCCVPAPR